jgi:putative ABC transport system permease protein
LKPLFLLRSVIREIRLQRLRSFLTVLGIVIGVAGVTTLVSAGEIVKSYVNQLAETLLGRPGTVAVRLDRIEKRLAGGGAALQTSGRRFSETDYSFMAERAHRYGAVATSPVVTTRILSSLVATDAPLGNRRPLPTTIIGASNELKDIRTFDFSAGRFFTRSEAQRRLPVAVIDEGFAEAAGKEPREILGHVVSASGHPLDRFVIVGVVANPEIFSFGSTVFVPWTSLLERVEDEEMNLPATQGTRDLGFTEFQFHARFKSPRAAGQAKFPLVRDIKFLGQDLSATVQDSAEEVRTVNQILTGIQVFIGIVAAISLIVGGVGLANVMFMSIGTRTNEIGIRRTFGATSSDIRRLFLGEAAVLTSLGGILGMYFALILISTGVGVVQVLVDFPLPTVVPFKTMWLGVSLSAGVGLAAGYRPATRASKISVVEALRGQ